MSIIHDALKKVQNSMQEKPITAETIVPPVIKESAASKKFVSNALKNALLIILSLAIIITSGYFLVKQVKSKHPQLFTKFNFKLPKKANPPPPLAQIVIPAAETTVISTPAPAQEAPIVPSTTANAPVTPQTPTFALNIQGVMASGTHNIALINDKVYEEGSVIEGRRIIKINLNTVTIEYEGKQEEIVIKK